MGAAIKGAFFTKGEGHQDTILFCKAYHQRARIIHLVEYVKNDSGAYVVKDNTIYIKIADWLKFKRDHNLVQCDEPTISM